MMATTSFTITFKRYARPPSRAVFAISKAAGTVHVRCMWRLLEQIFFGCNVPQMCMAAGHAGPCCACRGHVLMPGARCSWETCVHAAASQRARWSPTLALLVRNPPTGMTYWHDQAEYVCV
jgi:hypothetical protein